VKGWETTDCKSNANQRTNSVRWGRLLLLTLLLLLAISPSASASALDAEAAVAAGPTMELLALFGLLGLSHLGSKRRD